MFCFLSLAQVICKDWSNLAGKSYIILNMTENIDCVSAELAHVEGPAAEGGAAVGLLPKRGQPNPGLKQHLPLGENQKEGFVT